MPFDDLAQMRAEMLMRQDPNVYDDGASQLGMNPYMQQVGLFGKGKPKPVAPPIEVQRRSVLGLQPQAPANFPAVRSSDVPVPNAVPVPSQGPHPDVWAGGPFATNADFANVIKKHLEARQAENAVPVPQAPAQPTVAPLSQVPALKKYLKPSAVKNQVYHGSNQPGYIVGSGKFEHIEPYHSTIHWFADDPNLADKYTSGYAENYGDQGAIFPAYLQVKNPLTVPFDMNDKVSKDVWDFAKSIGVDKSEVSNWRKENDLSDVNDVWHIVNTPQFRSAAQQQGFDGISAKEKGTHTWGVFEPTQIKSTFNEGTFNVKNPNMGKKEGGLITLRKNKS